MVLSKKCFFLFYSTTYRGLHRDVEINILFGSDAVSNFTRIEPFYLLPHCTPALLSRWLNKLQTKISEHAVFDSVLGQESAHTPVLWILLGPGGRILSLRQDKNSQEGGLARYQHIAAGLLKLFIINKSYIII